MENLSISVDPNYEIERRSTNRTTFYKDAVNYYFDDIREFNSNIKKRKNAKSIKKKRV